MGDPSVIYTCEIKLLAGFQGNCGCPPISCCLRNDVATATTQFEWKKKKQKKTTYGKMVDAVARQIPYYLLYTIIVYALDLTAEVAARERESCMMITAFRYLKNK
jgi:hypothetical protein